jgi:hypothetical protein
MQRLRDAGIAAGERFLGSKLQMFDWLAIFALAQRDGVEFLDIQWKEGVVVDPETGFFWFDGNAKGCEDAVEIGWRFLNEETAVFYEVVWRACMAAEVDERARNDDLLQEISALKDSRPDLWGDALPFLRDALEVARTPPRPRSPREIVQRLAASLPPPEPVQPESPPEPKTAMERLLVERAERLRYVLARIETAPRSPLPGWKLVDFQPEYGEGTHGIRVGLEKDGERLGLLIRPSDCPGKAFAQSESIKIAYTPAAPVRTRDRAVRQLCSMLDYYLQHD